MSKMPDISLYADISDYTPEKKPGIVSSVIGAITGTGNSIVDEGRSLLNGVLESIKSVIPGAVSVANAALAQLSYSGSTGNFQSAEETIVLTAKFQPIVDTYPEKLGSPLYKKKVLSTLSGFLQCENAVISLNVGTFVEEQAIEAMLNTGIYFE